MSENDVKCLSEPTDEQLNSAVVLETGDVPQIQIAENGKSPSEELNVEDGNDNTEVRSANTEGEIAVEIGTEVTPEGNPTCDTDNQNQANSENLLSGQENDWKDQNNTFLQAIDFYMKCVADKTKHSQMIEDPTISGFLVFNLGDKNPQVVERCFELLVAFAKYPENFPALSKVGYLSNALRCVASNPSVKTNVRRDAKKINAALKSYSNKDQSKPLSELSESMKNVMVNSGHATATSGQLGGKTTETVKSTDLNGTMSTMKRKNKGRETILFVEDDVIQQKTERTKVTQALIAVPGIISVTYDLKKNLCIIRGKRSVAPEDFGRSVANLGIAKVHLVRKTENKEEVKILIQANEKENVQYPPYPEEIENEELGNSAAVAKTDKSATDNSSLLKSAKNFFKRSFYW